MSIDIMTPDQASEALKDLVRRRDAISNKAFSLNGKRVAAVEYEKELVHSVGHAKGRLLLRPKVEAFLDMLQERAHSRSVGTYETLLTAISKDVLQIDGQIGLNLSTERGLPALDIYLDKGEGRHEDIMDGTGGSLTNVISMGLRMIATVKSKRRQFVALDEADCWVKPTRVGSFYNVIDDMARNMNLQCLTISHHDASLLPESFAIHRLFLRDGKIDVEPDARMQPWDEERPGIRKIRLVNFMTHVDTTIPLAMGATAIVGDNHIGKSVVIRALRSLAYGDVSDADIRHGENSLEVHLEIEGKRTLRFTRQPGRNPVNEWTLLDQFKEPVISEKGMLLKSGGRQVPEWVGDALGILRMEDLETQISHQKRPVFLLTEPASKRASVLSIGRESAHIRTMIALYKDKCAEDSSHVKTGEKEVGRLRRQIDALGPIETLADDIAKLSKDLDTCVEERNVLDNMAALITKIEGLEASVRACDARINALSIVPRYIDDLEHDVALTARMVDIGRRLGQHANDLKIVDMRLSALSHIPETTPDVAATQAMASILESLQALSKKKTIVDAKIESLDSLENYKIPDINHANQMNILLEKIEDLMVQTSKVDNDLSKVDADISSEREKIEAMLGDLGGTCPTCGHATTADAILSAEIHSHV